MARSLVARSEPDGSPLVQRLHSLVVEAEATGGLRTRLRTLARTLGVEEHQVRRAAHWLASEGHIAILPAGREGSRFVAQRRAGRPQLQLRGRFCPWCGRPVHTEWHYCMGCGGSLSGGAASAGTGVARRGSPRGRRALTRAR